MLTQRQTSCFLTALVVVAATIPVPATAQERWTLHETQRRGQWGDAVAFGSIPAAAPGVDGLYVADGTNLEVIVLDSMLEPIRRFGREGAGPGEFRDISRMGVWGDTVSVVDMRLRRISVLSASGEELWTQGQFPPLATNHVPPWPHAALADGSVLVVGPDGGLPTDPERGLHRLERDSGHHRRIAPLYENGEVLQVELAIKGVRAFVERPVHGADRIAASPSGEIVAILKQDRPGQDGSFAAWLVALRPSGDTVWAREFAGRSAGIPAAGTRALEDLASAYAENVQELGIPRGEAYRAFLEGIDVPRHQWPFDRLVVGRAGGVLVRRGSFGLESAEWWRVVGGRVVATFSLPTSHELLAADGRRLWTRTRGELDEPVLVRWKAESAGN